LTTREDKRWK